MLEVNNLSKRYPSFCLQEVNFHLPKGMIMGFLGQNGAGKTTTLKCLVNAVVADSGEVWVDGRSMATDELAIKQDIGFALGSFDHCRLSKVGFVAEQYGKFFERWDSAAFEKYCKKFHLDANKRVKELSTGMRVKLSLALALSHNAKLFLLDEPTSGLDPVARDEVLEIFRDIVSDGEKSILFSTHITTDLEKCADLVLFLNNGRIVVDMPKDQLLEEHVMLKGGLDQLTEQFKQKVVSFKENSFGFCALALRSNIDDLSQFVTEKPTLDDMMVFYTAKMNKEVEQ